MAQEFNEMVRLLDTDIKGGIKTLNALTKVYGVNYSLANALCNLMNLNKHQRIGELSKEDLKKIEVLIREPKEIPVWMLNRRKDKATGENKHLMKADLKFQKDVDIKELQKIKSYRGIRHQLGLPVRGQRTRSNFRRGKTVGVRKKGSKGAAK